MLQKFIGKIWRAAPPFVRTYVVRATQKTFTVSVGAIVTNAEGKVLLLDHVLRPASGWGIPGGFLDQGEQPDAAIRRELREETGIELENLKMIRVRTLNRHIEMLFRAESNDVARVSSREIKSLDWFDVDKMPAEMNSAQKSTVEKVLRGEI